MDFDGELICAHCHLAHAVSSRMQAKYERRAQELGVPACRIWECGACWIAHLRFLEGAGQGGDVPVLCGHAVPPFTTDSDLRGV